MLPAEKRKPARGGGRLATDEVTALSSHDQKASASVTRTHAGFFRVSEQAIRLIHNSVEERWATRAAILAYVTLCRKANLRRSTTFEDRIASLAQDMAFEYRDTQKAICLLERLGLVKVLRRKIAGTKANAPSIYTVHTLLHDAPTSKRDVRTSGEDEYRSTTPQHSQEQSQYSSIHPNKEAAA